MSIFSLFKNKESSTSVPSMFPAVLGAVATGKITPMEEIPDEVFSAGVLGLCCGIDPIEGKVYAPADGTINQVADTLHAVGIDANGIEILIHVGVDTVEMKGEGFTSAVQLGQNVKKGDLLLTMELDKIRAAGHPAIVIMAVTNSDDFALIEMTTSDSVQAGDNILKVDKIKS